MRTNLIRTTLLAFAAIALLAPAAGDAQILRRDRIDRDHRGADWVSAELEKMTRQVHRQAESYYGGGRGERQVVLALHSLDDAARAFRRSGGDDWAFERLADAYFRAADALARVPYRAHVYGGFNRVDQLMNELFDRYGYRAGRFDRHGRLDRDRWDRDRWDRDRWERDRDRRGRWHH